MDINRRLGAAVRYYRLKAGLNQTDFGGSNSSLSRLERGEHGVSTERLATIAERIGVEVSEIWAYAERNGPRVQEPGDLRYRDSIAQEKAQIAAFTALASLVERVISTTPAAAKPFRDVLAKLLPTAASDEEREFLVRLTGRLAEVKYRAPSKSGARRARATFR